MLDSTLRPYIDPPLSHIAKILTHWNISANQLTAIGFMFGVGAFIALALQSYIVALVFIVLNRLADGLDGPLARQTQATDLGGYYDIVSDFIFYSGIIFFFALGNPDDALPAAFLIFSFMGTASSFLTYAIIATKHNITHEKQGRKSFYYLKGITEGSETFALLVFICLFPDLFPWAAYISGALCWLTTLGRTVETTKTFSS